MALPYTYQLQLSTDDASDTTPTWIDITQYLRGWSSNRGRSSELDDVNAGTLSLTLSNRDRRFDPTNTTGPYYPNLKPMNRVWLRVTHGSTKDIFIGYVESYEQQHPDLGMDALTVVNAVDEFKVLSLRNQPTSDPPRDSYSDLIQFDRPDGYWPMNDLGSTLRQTAVIGPELSHVSYAGSMSSTDDGAILSANPDPASAMVLSPTWFIGSDTTDPGNVPDMTGLSEMTVEFWFMSSTATPAGGDFMVQGPSSSGLTFRQWSFVLESTGGITFHVGNASGPTDVSVTTGAITANQWFHVVGVVGAGAITLYVNSNPSVTKAWGGVIATMLDGTWGFGEVSSAATMSFDEAAIYRYALPADRIAAHFAAGRGQGYARGELAGDRIDGILSAADNNAARSLDTGVRPLGGQWTGHGPNTLDAIRQVENAEAVDAFVFVAKNGTITFLDSNHRNVSPHNTVQATFGDAGGIELDFMDIQIDYSDSFIANEWNVTREGGTTQSSEDSTSISSYLRRSQSLTGLNLRDDNDAHAVATAMLSKYKEPLTRVLSIKPKMNNLTVFDAAFGLELGDRIRVLLTPLGTSPDAPSLYPSSTTYPSSSTYPISIGRFDQTLFIQSIQIDASPQDVYPNMILGVSPV